MTRTYDNMFASNLMVDVAHIPLSDGTSEARCREFVSDLIELLGMKPHGEAQVEHFGEGKLQGWTVSQLIETSHVVAHFMDPVYDKERDRGRTFHAGSPLCGLHLDVSSCGVYSPSTVMDFIRSRWPGSTSRARHFFRSLPGQKHPRVYYDGIAPGYDSFYSTAVDRYEDARLVDRIAKGSSSRVLDIGCGTGAGLRLVTDAGGLPERSYIGTDVSGRMLDQFWFNSPSGRVGLAGGRFWYERGHQVDLRQGKASECLHDVGEGFDLVLGLWSLHYMESLDLELVLARARTATAPGGRFIAAICGPEYAHTGDYVCGSDPSQIKIPRTEEWLSRMVLAGWKSVESFGMTGPLVRRMGWAGRRALGFAARQEERVLGPFDHRYRFTVLEALA